MPERGGLLDHGAAPGRWLVRVNLQHEAAACLVDPPVALGRGVALRVRAQRRGRLVVRLALGGGRGAERRRRSHAVAVSRAALPLPLVRACGAVERGQTGGRGICVLTRSGT